MGQLQSVLLHVVAIHDCPTNERILLYSSSNHLLSVTTCWIGWWEIRSDSASPCTRLYKYALNQKSLAEMAHVDSGVVVETVAHSSHEVTSGILQIQQWYI